MNIFRRRKCKNAFFPLSTYTYIIDSEDLSKSKGKKKKKKKSFHIEWDINQFDGVEHETLQKWDISVVSQALEGEMVILFTFEWHFFFGR